MLGIDLRNVSYVHVNPDKRQAVLLLPKPHLIMWKVDHIRSELDIDSRVWVPLSSKQRLRDEVWQVADRTIERLAREEPSYTKRAKIQAELVLETLFKGLGWAVAFEWQQATGKAADKPQAQPDGSLARTAGIETAANNTGNGAAVPLPSP